MLYCACLAQAFELKHVSKESVFFIADHDVSFLNGGAFLKYHDHAFAISSMTRVSNWS